MASVDLTLNVFADPNLCCDDTYTSPLPVQDAAAGLYEALHLNFVTSIPGPIMEQLASGGSAVKCMDATLNAMQALAEDSVKRVAPLVHYTAVISYCRCQGDDHRHAQPQNTKQRSYAALYLTSGMSMHAGAVASSCVQRIAKVHDQYLAFIALEAGLFTLGLPNAYLDLNDPAAGDTQIEVRQLHQKCMSL